MSFLPGILTWRNGKVTEQGTYTKTYNHFCQICSKCTWTQPNLPLNLMCTDRLHVGSSLPAHILLVDRFIMTHLICSQKWLYIWQKTQALHSDKSSAAHWNQLSQAHFKREIPLLCCSYTKKGSWGEGEMLLWFNPPLQRRGQMACVTLAVAVVRQRLPRPSRSREEQTSLLDDGLNAVVLVGVW